MYLEPMVTMGNESASSSGGSHDGVMPALGFGTWQLIGRRVQSSVLNALSIGYRHIDTAQMYENESDVGNALRESEVPRDEIFVTTKLSPGHLHRQDVRRTTHASLRRLGLEYVDALLIHWPNDEVPLDETLGAMRELQESGLVRHIGVSNFSPALFDQALRIAPVSCLQVEYHPFLRQPALLEMARSARVFLTAYSPLARGRVGDDALLREIGRRHDKTAAQVALRWLIQQQGVGAIPKASSQAHMLENFDIFDFSLSPEEMRSIFALGRGERLVDPPWAPDWDALPSPDLRRGRG